MIREGTFSGRIKYNQTGQKWDYSHESPLYLNTIKRGKSMLAIPSDMSGGLRNGDSQKFTVTLKERASLLWEAPASTLFHRSTREEAAALNQEISVNEESSLRFLGKVNIPCAGANIVQSTRIEADAKSSLFYLDIWSAGRTASGEEWAFDSLKNRLNLFYNNSPIYKEAWTLKKDHIPKGASGFRGASLWITIIALGKEPLAFMEKKIAEFRNCGFLIEAAPVAEGVMLCKGLGGFPEN